MSNISGTVYGAGYDCRKNMVANTEGSHDGIWNNVIYHVPWIEAIAAQMGEKLCFGLMKHFVGF